MGLKVGTLVQPYEVVEIDSGMPVMGRSCTESPISNQCVGILVKVDIADEGDNSSGFVRWVQNCPKHRNYGVNGLKLQLLDNLWEIGQLY